MRQIKEKIRLLFYVAAGILMCGFYQNCSDVEIAAPEKVELASENTELPQESDNSGPSITAKIIVYDSISASTVQTRNNPANIKFVGVEDANSWCVVEHDPDISPEIPDVSDACFFKTLPSMVLLKKSGLRKVTVFFQYLDGEIKTMTDTIEYITEGQALSFSPMAPSTFYSGYGMCKLLDDGSLKCLTEDEGANPVFYMLETQSILGAKIKYAQGDRFITEDGGVYIDMNRHAGSPTVIGGQTMFDSSTMGTPVLAKGHCVLNDKGKLWCSEAPHPFVPANNLPYSEVEFSAPIDNFATTRFVDNGEVFAGVCFSSRGRIFCKGHFPIKISNNPVSFFQICYDELTELTELQGSVLRMLGKHEIQFQTRDSLWLLGSMHVLGIFPGGRLRKSSFAMTDTQSPYSGEGEFLLSTHNMRVFSDKNILGYHSADVVGLELKNIFRSVNDSANPIVEGMNSNKLNLGLIWGSAEVMAVDLGDGRIRYLKQARSSLDKKTVDVFDL